MLNDTCVFARVANRPPQLILEDSCVPFGGFPWLGVLRISWVTQTQRLHTRHNFLICGVSGKEDTEARVKLTRAHAGVDDLLVYVVCWLCAGWGLHQRRVDSEEGSDVIMCGAHRGRISENIKSGLCKLSASWTHKANVSDTWTWSKTIATV